MDERLRKIEQQVTSVAYRSGADSLGSLNRNSDMANLAHEVDKSLRDAEDRIYKNAVHTIEESTFVTNGRLEDAVRHFD